MGWKLVASSSSNGNHAMSPDGSCEEFRWEFRWLNAIFGFVALKTTTRKDVRDTDSKNRPANPNYPGSGE